MTEGSKIIYRFPNPKPGNDNFVIGIIEYIGDAFVNIRTTDNIMLKITYKNYDRIEPFSEDKLEINPPEAA